MDEGGTVNPDFSDKERSIRDEVERSAVRSFGEMIARHDPAAVAAYKGIGTLFSRRYRVDVDNDALNRLRELDAEHAILWLPSHRSYLDMFYLEQVAQQAGIQPAFVLGGDNLDFWPINDHANSLTARRWQETIRAVRQCNEIGAAGADKPVQIRYSRRLRRALD